MAMLRNLSKYGQGPQDKLDPSKTKLFCQTVGGVSEKDEKKKKIVVFFICTGCRDPPGLGSVSG